MFNYTLFCDECQILKPIYFFIAIDFSLDLCFIFTSDRLAFSIYHKALQREKSKTPADFDSAKVLSSC